MSFTCHTIHSFKVYDAVDFIIIFAELSQIIFQYKQCFERVDSGMMVCCIVLFFQILQKFQLKHTTGPHIKSSPVYLWVPAPHLLHTGLRERELTFPNEPLA